jgi:hypothetical protein
MVKYSAYSVGICMFEVDFHITTHMNSHEKSSHVSCSKVILIIESLVRILRTVENLFSIYWNCLPERL